MFIESISSEFPVGNAAGWCKSLADVEDLSRSNAQFIIVGSITIPSRDGHPGNTFDGASLNSLGLPNPGIMEICGVAEAMVETAHAVEKPIILSVAGSSPTEYRELTILAHKYGFDGVELNLGCPNVIEDGYRKAIPSYDPELTSEILTEVIVALDWNHDFFVSVKLSPLDPGRLQDMAEVLVNREIDAIVTQNTVPNCLAFDTQGKPAIQTPDGTGWAGLSGREVKKIALGQVSQWRHELRNHRREHIKLWGVGGVACGLDVKHMQLAGADVVQVGTAYMTSGPRVFSDIAGEFLGLSD